MTTTNDGARLILALAAEADDDFIWSRLKTLQTEMFAAGPVEIKFAYFGREGASAIRPYVSTGWVKDPDDMADLMDRGRAHCVCGCYVDVGDILAAASDEVRQAPVQAVIIVGDRFHGDLDAAFGRAEQLRVAGTRLFLFQQGRSHQAENEFRALAEQTGGAYFQFNPAVERVAEKLPGLFEAVTHFAIGGTRALEVRANNESAALLLEQMTAPSLLK
jgi:hypothetical protein